MLPPKYAVEVAPGATQLSESALRRSAVQVARETIAPGVNACKHDRCATVAPLRHAIDVMWLNAAARRFEHVELRR
jgi:hypothetical protein